MSHPNPSTAMAQVFIDELARNGVRRIVVSPGSRSGALALAAATHPAIAATIALDERSAGFHALGIGKAGELAAVVVTSGTAVANLMPAVVEAEMSATPLIVVAADRPAELRGVGANQTIDQVGIFGGHVRWFVDVSAAEDRLESNVFWRSTVCQAVAKATGTHGAAGPVHMNLAFREPLAPLADLEEPQPFVSPTEGRTRGGPWSEVDRSVPRAPGLRPEWAAVERGLVVVGAGSANAGPADRLAAALGWPLIAEPSPGGRPAQAITTAHFLAGHWKFAEEHNPDIALVIGRPGLSRAFGQLLDGVPRIVVAEGSWSDPTRDAIAILNGFPSVDSMSIPDRGGDWRRSWLQAEGVARVALDRALDAVVGMSELRIARDTVVAAGSTLVVASSMPIRDLDIAMPALATRIVSNRGASGVDGFVSTTLGVGAVEGSAVALAGDLSMLHDQNGFLTTPRSDAVFVVVNNNGGGIFSFLPQASVPEHFELVFGTPHGRSFQKYAALYDVEHRLLARPHELTEAIIAAREAGGLHLIEATTDRQSNVDAHREVGTAVHAALG